MSLKLLEDIAIQTSNGIELVPKGTMISETFWNLDTGKEEPDENDKKYSPQQLDMLAYLTQFKTRIDPKLKEALKGPFKDLEKAISEGDAQAIKDIYKKYVNLDRGSNNNLTEFVKVLMALRAQGKKHFGESIIQALDVLIESINRHLISE